MSIFKVATNETAYLKAGLLGFQGSGKTYTAVELILGLHQHCKSDKPVYFLDTETGSDWAIPRFAKEGIELRVAKTRAFKDLLAGIQEAEKNGFGLIIDSVSHYWTELIESYKRRKNIRGQMPFYHWGHLKPEWGKFSSAYVNSKLHIAVCGRAGWEWGHEADSEGNKELMKLGTKMKVEGEFGFEPSLLLEMERIKGHSIGDRIEHQCSVIKDRRMDEHGMDGKVIVNPKFDHFLPHVECLNLGGNHLGVDESKNSEDMFEPKGESYNSIQKRKNIAIEEINGELEFRYPGTTKDNKLKRAAVKKHIFGFHSETQLAEVDVSVLDNGLARVVEVLHADDWSEQVDKIVKDLMAPKAPPSDPLDEAGVPS